MLKKDEWSNKTVFEKKFGKIQYTGCLSTCGLKERNLQTVGLFMTTLPFCDVQRG